ncbi:MAG: DUF327 family protein [Spirochaetota bacterium]
MDIKGVSTKKNEQKSIRNKKTGMTTQAGKNFQAELDSTISTEYHGTIDKLMNDLAEQEKRFVEEQSLYQMNKYKSLVRSIMKMLLDSDTSVETLQRRRRDRADFVIVDKINDRLDLIATTLTQKSNKAFNLLKTIEEIRGLLLDLRH